MLCFYGLGEISPSVTIVVRSPEETNSIRRLPFFGSKMKIEASVLLGDRDEEVEVHGESDYWCVGRR